jgi:peptide/nickel transport system substrate-binding protein
VYGGRVIVHLTSIPKHLNYATENSAVTRRMLYELTETLLLQDWHTHEMVPNVASGFVQEDMLVLTPEAYGQFPQSIETEVRPRGQGEPYRGRVVYGQIEEQGEQYLVTPLTQGGSALKGPLVVPKSAAVSVERGCALTFKLRPGVRWQPATGEGPAGDYRIENQTLDAEDIRFSWSLYSNPGVECDDKRFQFLKVPVCEVVGPLEVRFLAREQYYATLESLGKTMTLLPRHLYDLTDPDCPWFDAEASPEAVALHINQNPHNQRWVGLGPYQLTAFDQQYIEAQRFDGYFDSSRAGYFDTIRWRYVADDNLAFQALINGELDFFERVKSADYFGPATESATFTERFYKGYKYLGTYGYTGWNTHRPYLSDKRVRQAFAHAFPFDDFLKTNYKNLARQTTGPFPVDSEAYDHSVKPYPYDLAKARSLLTEAGFIDSDGNGYVDKDGRDLRLEFLFPSGNEASKNMGLKLKEEFGRIGVGLELVPLEWATFLDRTKKRDFDACNLAWVPDLESDPEQTWHSKWGQPTAEGSNNSGIREPELDALIEAGQREIDRAKRQEIWKSIHRFLHDWQPYLFAYNVPFKFAVSRRLRGVQNFAVDPGYSLRNWHFVSLKEPGTRPTLAR